MSTMDSQRTDAVSSVSDQASTLSTIADDKTSQSSAAGEFDRGPRPNYQHEPLEANQIRLFRILPGQKDGLVRLMMEHYIFAQAEGTRSETAANGDQSSSTPLYYSLSYTWGSRIPTKCIEVDGRPFHIRLNLWSFLKRLELPCCWSNYLWADAICINQLDNSEKSVQVRIMNQIFGCAYGVLAWVGEEAGDSHTLVNVAETIRHLRGDVKLMSLYAAAERIRVWKALKDFLERPYWKRTWIVQEITLADGPIWVYCGVDVTSYSAVYGLLEIFKMCVELGDLEAFRCRCRKRQNMPCKHRLLVDLARQTCRLQIPTLRSYHQAGKGGRRILDPTLNHFYYQDDSRERLSDLLYRYADTECEDSRDKIFALLHVQTDIPEWRVPYLINYDMDVHFLFFEILTMYTRASEFLEREPEERFFLYREKTESLVECGILLVRTLQISLSSLWEWVQRTAFIREQYRNYWVFRPKVVLEHICGYAGGASVSSVLLNRAQEQFSYFEFDVVDHWRAARPHMRGVAVDTRVGDWILRAEGSDLAVVVRDVIPVSWAIIGEGSDWQPSELTLRRLEMAHSEPILSRSDFTAINEKQELEQITEMMRRHITEMGIPTEDLPLQRIHEHDQTAPYTRCYSVTIDLPIALQIMLGHFRTKREIERDNKARDKQALTQRELTAQLFGRGRNTRVLRWRKPHILLKRPWRRIRSRRTLPIRMHDIPCKRSRRHALLWLWRVVVAPLVKVRCQIQRLKAINECKAL